MGFTNPYPASRLTVDSTNSLVTGMQAWFPLTQGSGTVAQCILHPSHTGTLGSGVTWETSERGTVAVFDGTSNAKISFSSQLVSGQTLSFSVWLYVASSVSGNRTIYADGQTFVQNHFRYDGNGKRFAFDHYTPSGDPNKTNTDYGIDDRWIHVVVTQDSSTTKIYYDGVLKHTGTAETYASSAPTVFNIGSRGSSESFDGKMQNFQAWDRVISADEVAILHSRPWEGSNYGNLWPYSPPASASMTLSTDTAATSLMTNCIGWWPLTTGSGTTAKDVVGSNDGTLTSGISWANSSLGNASEHPSSANEYISTGLDLAGKSAVTVSAWIRNDGSGSGNNFGKVVSQSHSGNFDTYINKTGNSSLAFDINSTVVSASNSDIPAIGTWFHVCFVWEQSVTQAVYINGVLSGSGTADSSVIGSTTHNVFIGGTSAAPRPWDGGIQNVRIWDRALSSDEVAVLADRPWEGIEYGDTFHYDPPAPASMLPLTSDSINTDQELWYPLTDGTSTTAVDIAGSNNGTLGSTASWAGGSKLGTALELDGSVGSYVATPTITSISQPITHSIWFNNSEASQNGYLFDGFGSHPRHTVNFSGDTLYAFGGSSSLTIGSGGQFNDGEWHNLTAVFNDPSSTFYVDGVLIATGSVGTHPWGGTNIGQRITSTFNFNGELQNYRVWSRALTANEIWSIYANPWLGSNYKLASGSTPLYNYIFRTERFRRLG